MKELIRSFDFTKETTQNQIEEALLSIPDFSSNYYSVISMRCNSYTDAAKEIYNHLHSLN